jgi:hypothetical protein
MRITKRLELSPHSNAKELERRYKKARDPVERSHLQIEAAMLYDVAGLTHCDIGEALHVPPEGVRVNRRLDIATTTTIALAGNRMRLVTPTPHPSLS